ncbi:hypothetical protein V490_06716 [Pseudogymnoascus sp. VKM F-3557]|nr:hypothetical protein V490_06716 [Pseudogymnoascus sp. VKM F-3557]
MPSPGHHYQDVRICEGAKAILGDTYNIQVTASLAFDIYKSCLSTSYFRTLAHDVASFRSLLDFTVEKVETSNPRHKDIESITRIIDGCFKCLQEIESSISKFNKLPTASQRTWERIESGAGEIIQLRVQLGTSIELLSSLNIQLASSSQEAVQMMLYKFIDEVRTGRREDSIISTNSLSLEEQDSWRTVRKELEDVGITPQLFIENCGWIKETLQYSRESGALQEQPLATQQFSSEAESSDYSIEEEITTQNQNTTALVQQPSSHLSSASIPHTSDSNNSMHSGMNSTFDTTQNAIAENCLSQDLKLQHKSVLSIRQKDRLNSTYDNDRQLLNLETSLSTDPQPHNSPISPSTLVGRSELIIDKALPSNIADNDVLSETSTSHQTKEDCEWFYCPREDCPRSKGGIGFTKPGYLAKHRPVHESRRYACPFCHSSDDPHLYQRRDSLRRHLRNSHRDRNNSQLREALAFRMPPAEDIS